VDRAEAAVLAHLRRRGVAGCVLGARLYLNLCDALGDLSDYRGTGVLAVDLAGLPDVAPRPAAMDWPDWVDGYRYELAPPVDPLDAARALGRTDAEAGVRRDPGLHSRAECLAYCVARDDRRRELAELPAEADREWAASMNDDASGLTADDEARLELSAGTVSALDVLLATLDRDPEEGV
jgi:hypothetical protein